MPGPSTGPYCSATVAQGGAAVQEGLSGPDQQEESVAEQHHTLCHILEDSCVGLEKDVQSKGCNHHIGTCHLWGEMEGRHVKNNSTWLRTE